jgi:hypothetical protein
VAASDAYGRRTPAILSVRDGYGGDRNGLHQQEEVGRRDAPDICQGVEEKRRANDFKGCGDEFGARDAADGGDIVGLSGSGQRPLSRFGDCWSGGTQHRCVTAAGSAPGAEFPSAVATIFRMLPVIWTAAGSSAITF